MAPLSGFTHCLIHVILSSAASLAFFQISNTVYLNTLSLHLFMATGILTGRNLELTILYCIIARGRHHWQRWSDHHNDHPDHQGELTFITDPSSSSSGRERRRGTRGGGVSSLTIYILPVCLSFDSPCLLTRKKRLRQRTRPSGELMLTYHTSQPLLHCNNYT